MSAGVGECGVYVCTYVPSDVIEGLGGQMKVVVVFQYSHLYFPSDDRGDLLGDSMLTEEVIIVPMHNYRSLRVLDGNVALHANRFPRSQVIITEPAIFSFNQGGIGLSAIIHNDHFNVGIIYFLEENKTKLNLCEGEEGREGKRGGGEGLP